MKLTRALKRIIYFIVVILMPSAIIWDANPELCHIGPFTLRWYSLCFTAAFIVAFPLWRHMFAKGGKEDKDAEQLSSYLILAVIVGARLGHVIFYEWSYYKYHLWQIFLPVVFEPKFRIVGFSGLASHGAGIGLIVTTFFYVKRIKVSVFPPRIQLQNRKVAGEFLWILDHLSILVALGGAFIRIGNFMNSEIIGKPTHRNYGVVFARDLRDGINYTSIIESFTISKAAVDATIPIKNSYQPIQLTLSFKERPKIEITNFLESSLKNALVRLSYCSEPMVYETYNTPLAYTLKVQNGGYQAIVHTLGIPRHPAQLYEAFSCFLIFIALFTWWYKKGQILAAGRISGTFMVVVFTLRFFYECYKENQVAFEHTMWLNMGQLLSLPCIIIGLFLILRPVPQQIDR